MTACLMVAVANPAAIVANANASGKPTGRRRASTATAVAATNAATAAHSAGSRSAVK
jgi:hypothetical protein